MTKKKLQIKKKKKKKAAPQCFIFQNFQFSGPEIFEKILQGSLPCQLQYMFVKYLINFEGFMLKIKYIF
jgi:hypothetical protein